MDRRHRGPTARLHDELRAHCGLDRPAADRHPPRHDAEEPGDRPVGVLVHEGRHLLVVPGIAQENFSEVRAIPPLELRRRRVAGLKHPPMQLRDLRDVRLDEGPHVTAPSRDPSGCTHAGFVSIRRPTAYQVTRSRRLRWNGSDRAEGPYPRARRRGWPRTPRSARWT